MDISAALAADLALLSEALLEPDADVTGTLQRLIAGARSAVASFVGLTVTVSGTGTSDDGAAADGATDDGANDDGAAADRPLLRFTLLDDGVAPERVATSLLVPLPVPDAPGRPVVAVVLYAATQGAFVDMAADLSFATGRDIADVVLDQHCELAAEPDVTGGVGRTAVVHEAVGVLIARGRTAEQAVAELDAMAAAAGTDRPTEAARLLDGLDGPAPTD